MLCLKTINKDIVNYLQSLDIVSFSMLPSIIALLLADGITANEQEVLGNVITDIGGILTTIASYIEAEKVKEEDKDKEKEEQADKEKDKQSDKVVTKEDKDEREKMWQHIEALEKKNQDMQNHIDYLEGKIKKI